MTDPHFDALASTWDDDPMKIERARRVAATIVDRVDLQGAHVLEDGCGTGLLGFALFESAVLATLTFIDPSEGMRDVVARKIEQAAPGRACVLAPGEDPGVGRDLVTSLMVLHHVPDPVGKILEWARWLEPGGHLAVADLYSEDGSFHGVDADHVHRGFDPRQVRAWMEEAGLVVSEPTTVFEIEKEVEGEARRYPVWLLLGRRLPVPSGLGPDGDHR